MKLEVGKKYRSRDGKVETVTHAFYCKVIQEEPTTYGNHPDYQMWYPNGRASEYGELPIDLVEEVVDEETAEEYQYYRSMGVTGKLLQIRIPDGKAEWVYEGTGKFHESSGFSLAYAKTMMTRVYPKFIEEVVPEEEPEFRYYWDDVFPWMFCIEQSSGRCAWIHPATGVLESFSHLEASEVTPFMTEIRPVFLKDTV